MATTAHVPNQGEEPTARVAAVNNARQSWIRKLIDLSRRNNLLYYRPLKTGTLDLSNADAELMAHLLSGSAPVSVNKLLPNGHDDLPLSALRDIARRALANAEEKGLKTLFVALGMATWPASDGGRPTDAPILLLPVQLDTKGSQSFSLTRTGTVQVNLVLLHVLNTQYGIKVSSDDLIPHLTGDDEGEPFDARPLYDQLRQRAADIPGFDVKSCAILGNFAFQKMAMVKDVQERGAELAAHDIIAAIAGDNGARNAVSQSQQDIDPRELDRVLPENEFIVLDADSSQQCGIAAVLAGQSAVIHGPPGTGKSQTIVNLVASLAAAGKRILFVAEKRAALEVVLRRLREVGLAHLAIDLHGADLAPKRVMQQIAEALDKLRNAGPVDCEKIHDQLLDRRTRLNEHVRRLHTPRQPTGMSLYEMQGRLLRLSEKVASSTRWRGEQLDQITPSVALQVRDLLADAAGFEHLFLRTASSRWTGAKLTDGSDVARALDVVSRLERDTLPAFLVSLHAIVQETGLALPTSIRGAKHLAALITDVQTTLSMYDSMIYQQNLASLLRDLSPGKSGGLASVWAWCTNSAFRRSSALINGFRTAAKAPISIMFRELTTVLTQAQQWKSLAKGGSLPCTVNNHVRHHKALRHYFVTQRHWRRSCPILRTTNHPWMGLPT